MDDIKTATKVLIALLLALAIGLTALAASRATGPRQSETLIAIAVICGMAAAWRFPVHFAAKSKLYVDTAVTIAAVLLLQPAYAALAVGIGTLIAHVIRDGGTDWPEALFNVAQVTLVVLAAAILLALAGWQPLTPTFDAPWPLLVLPLVTVVTYFLNIFLIAAVAALEAASPVRSVFWSTVHEDLPFEALTHVTLVAIGTLIALVTVAQPWGVVLLAIPIVATHHTVSHQTRLRQEAERARIMSEASLAEAQHMARIGSWEWYPKTNRWVWSDEVYRIFGLARRPTSPTHCDLLTAVHPNDRESVERALDALRQNRAPFAIEHQIQRHDGCERFVQQRGEVRPTENGTVMVIGTVQDITERVRAEQTMRDATRAAQEADRAKSQLLTMASHDLRTPLTAIQGYIEMVTNGSAGKINAEQRELLDIAHRNALDLSGLISDLLDLARIEAGGLRLKVVPTSVSLIVENVLSTLSSIAAAKGISLTSTPVHRALLATADPARLNQIMLNLIANAVKFTDQGGVTINVGEDGEWIVIDVSDTGIGIPSELLPHIFEEFNQGGEEARRKGGAGLGLAIVKQLVELHEGTIAVESTHGAGTAFTIRLPAALPTNE